MKFVTPAHHAEVVAVLHEALRAERDANTALRRQLSDLSGKYHQLRLSGYQPAPEVLQSEPREHDALRAAILARSKGDPRLRAAGLAQLERDRDAGIPDEAIALRVAGGVSLDSEEGLPA